MSGVGCIMLGEGRGKGIWGSRRYVGVGLGFEGYGGLMGKFLKSEGLGGGGIFRWG